MIYIYNDYGGTHTTILAAYYHLKKLDETRHPTHEEIQGLRYFNGLDYHDQGKLFRHGTDEDGNPVYTLGRGRSKILIPGIRSLILMLEEEGKLHERIILSNTSPTVPPLLTMGGFLSRGLKWKSLGDPLVMAGAKQACGNVIRMVRHTKVMAKQSSSQVLVLDNKEFQYRMLDALQKG